MKKTQRSKPVKRDDEMKAEYDFDYRKAKPNRFAGRAGKNCSVVVLNEDVTMEDDPKIKKRLREFDARILRKFDQELQEVHNLYSDLSSKEKEDFRSWLAKLTEVSEPKPEWLPMLVHVYTHAECRDQRGDVVYESSATLSPKVLLHAVDAWDREEEFTPKSAFGTF